MNRAYIYIDRYLITCTLKVKNDHRRKFSNLSSWKEEASKKKIRASDFFQASSFQLLKLENLQR